MKQNAVIYFSVLNNEDNPEMGLALCTLFAKKNDFNIVKSTSDFLDLVLFVTSNPGHTIIIPSYYNFAKDPSDMGFIEFFQNYGTEVISVEAAMLLGGAIFKNKGFEGV